MYHHMYLQELEVEEEEGVEAMSGHKPTKIGISHSQEEPIPMKIKDKIITQ